ncbi:hypothetical protein EMIT0P218_20328 [Pseudomonas sp. IT-P218]
MRQGEQASDQCGIDGLWKKGAAAAAALQQTLKRIELGRVHDPVSIDESRYQASLLPDPSLSREGSACPTLEWVGGTSGLPHPCIQGCYQTICVPGGSVCRHFNPLARSLVAARPTP